MAAGLNTAVGSTIGRGCVKRALFLSNMASSQKGAVFYCFTERNRHRGAEMLGDVFNKLVRRFQVIRDPLVVKMALSGHLQLFHDLRHSKHIDGPPLIIGEHVKAHLGLNIR